MIISDLDGTLLNGKGRITPYTKKVIQTLEKNGHVFVIATGRIWKSGKYIHDQYGIGQYLISHSGAHIYDLKRQVVIFDQPIPKSLVSQLFHSFSNIITTFIICTAESWNSYVVIGTQKSRLFTNSIGDINQFLTDLSDNIYKIEIFFQRGWNQTAFLIQFKDQYHILDIILSESNRSHETFAEISPKGINKDSAIKILCKHLDIDCHDTIAFGDQQNDLAMIKNSGLGIAVGNASEEIKRNAKEIIGTNQKNAVAHYLADHYLTKS